MTLGIWNYMRGYVIIKVTGFSIERFINMALHKGIYIWDVENKDNAVYMKVSIKGFKMLRDCQHKTKCRAVIVGKKGLPFQLYRYRKRKVLALGVAVFICFMYLMSSFIWVVEITGNERLAQEDVLGFFSENNLHQGTFKGTVNTNELTKQFLAQFPDVSFAAIEISGTKAKINIVETLPAPPVIDKATPCDIVAAKDGLILNIVTSAGSPAVKEKDVVKKGDVLVSGKILIKSESEVKGERYVHASAEVYAKLWYEVTLKEKFTYIEKVFTGDTKTSRGFSIFGAEFFMKPKSPYEFFESETITENLNIGEFILPITVASTEYKEYTEENITLSVEQAEQKLKERLVEKIDKELDKNIEILDISTEFTPSETELVLKARVTTKERIDKEVIIQ